MIRFLADYTLIIILVISGGTVLWHSVRYKKWRYTPFMIMAGLSSLLVAKIASIAYQPTAVRPFIERGVAPGASYIDNPGFPSDHALLGGAALLAMYVVTRNQRLALVVLLLFIAMIAGRVIAMVHTPLDIAGGVLAALVGGIWYLKMPHRKA